MKKLITIYTVLAISCGYMILTGFTSASTVKTENANNSLFSKTKFDQVIVKGKVIDSDGIGIPGVVIQLKGTPYGILTDIDGKYKITADLGDILIFSYVGFLTTQRLISSSTVNVTMLESTNDFD